jgi:DNA-directed RNA polymerase subunit N (RpoN/RPB10)
MKRVVRCLGCGNIARLYGSFRVELQERIKSPLTGEVKESTVVGQICRKCSREAGYSNE